MVQLQRSAALQRTSASAAWSLLLMAFAAAMTSPAHAIESCEGIAYAPGRKTLLCRESHWMLQDRGTSNSCSDDGDNLVVSIEFPPSESRRNVARSEVDAAVAATLTRRCPP